ncbi:hypothetical protein AVEN_110179-1 [Araneus ventricosus]|uniref:Tc1-like transposase DDE domain-containing protein n=1 Tax=Araneus ventricosus TaxID=182803 RepID=A0A4Y2MP61_ARAVE|nr:hypothetical protein AVEN_110179-1 [Araneus ventricosus]
MRKSIFRWHTYLYLLPHGTLNPQMYRDDLLDLIARPYTGTIGDTFILQADNASPYIARHLHQFLEEETIFQMEWSECSLDLNSIQHVFVTRRLSAGFQLSP